MVAARVIRYTVESRGSLSKLNFTSRPFFSKAVILGIPAEWPTTYPCNEPYKTARHSETIQSYNIIVKF